MTISGKKTKLLPDGEQQHSEQPPITLKGQSQEGVESFFYLDSEAGQNGKVEKKVTVRLVKAGVVYQMWRWKVSEATTSARTPSYMCLPNLSDAFLTVWC